MEMKPLKLPIANYSSIKQKQELPCVQSTIPCQSVTVLKRRFKLFLNYSAPHMIK